jgi:PAS domain-containing protein
MSYAEWLSTVHPEDRDRLQAYHENLLRGTGRGEAEFRIIWPDGSVHWVVSKAKAYRRRRPGLPRDSVSISM